MKNIIKCFNLLLLIILSSWCHASENTAQGEWKYKLFLNEIEVGYAIIINRTENNNYITSSEYLIKFKNITTVTKDTVIETLDFKPVKLQNYSKIESAGKFQETNIVSTFNGRNVELIHGDKKYKYKLNRDYIIDGNYFMSLVMKAKFKPGFEAVNYIYNPAVELDTPIQAKTKVIGPVTIIINGKKNKLIHIVQSIENIKENINLYVDEKGILHKGIIYMLNLKIELIRI